MKEASFFAADSAHLKLANLSYLSSCECSAVDWGIFINISLSKSKGKKDVKTMDIERTYEILTFS